MQSGFVLDAIVREASVVLQLLVGKEQSLLVKGNTLLVFDLPLHPIDRFRRLHIQGDSTATHSLGEDLYASSQSEVFATAEGRILSCR